MSLRDLLDGLLDGDRHQGGIRAATVFRLDPGFFDALRREVEKLCTRQPASHAGRADHVTTWANPTGTVTQHSLLNRSGRTDDFTSDHDFSCLNKWFFDDGTAPTVARLVAEWPHLINLRINVLGPGALLAAHEEHIPFRTAGGGVGARLRFHLPLVTNPAAELNLDGDVVHLETATIHLVNQGCVHAAVNRGQKDRIHIVWDMLLTREAAALLLGTVPCPSWASTCGLAPVVPHRHERIGPHRRQPPSVSPREAAQMAPCPPQ